MKKRDKNKLLEKVMIQTDKRAVFFSIDALIALFIIFLSILVFYPLVKTINQTSFIQGDIINILSSLKIGEIDNSYAQQLIAQGKITDLNKSILEQIGEFYVNDVDIAKNLTDSILSSLNINENIGIWYGNTLLGSKSSIPYASAKNIEVERQIISGIKQGAGVTGFSARAFLSNNMQTEYFYFGGYVGEGNLSARMEYDGNISSAEMELTISDDFQVYVNGNLAGSYTKSPSDFIPQKYSIPITDFISGVNTIEIIGDNLHISGGYIKLTYESNSVQYEQLKKYYFPGINGITNLYDGFYVPGQLNSLDISLHLNNELNAFLILGDVVVYNSSTSGIETITIPDAQLSSLLNYNALSYKTIPIRFGLENVSYLFNASERADVFSVTSISGGMSSNIPGTTTKKIDAAKAANNIFIDIMLDNPLSRIGVLGYETSVKPEDYHALSTDSASLKAVVNNWKPGASICVCCGVNTAVSGLLNDSNSSNFRSMVVMSDGAANTKCSEQGTGSAKQDAIKAACDAYANYGIRVYTIGFGSSADAATLQAMSSCGNGSYYSTIDDLIYIYEQIANELIETIYYEQTLQVIGDVESRLYSDSYIEFDYTKPPAPYGLITTSEKLFSNDSAGSFTLPPTSSILETRVVSYSGPRWTDKVEANGNLIYDLSSYGSVYTKLGDPYVINIPNSSIQQNNTITVTTGWSPGNSTTGSVDNKIIYTILRDMISYNSSIASVARGCIWKIQFGDDTNLTSPIPTNYTGSSLCYYDPVNQVYDMNDAIQIAVYNLLKLLDLNQDGRLDTKITEQNLLISSSEVTGIPYDWNTEVQVRRWR